ncbi:MAG TPA: NUDIX hydrolase [Bacteroidia bacterium]|jgi:8-oxo-dGTP pyrophosphatase MutT (NUDIX family)|nr:NUDIX hydrolase [Bacteroidia bacterium]
MKPAIVTCGIYLYCTPLKKILVCHATRSPWNSWSIPKGLPDEGEEVYAAAVRELYEETGIEIKQLHVLATHNLEAKKYQKQNKILESFLVVTNSDLSKHPLACHSLTEMGYPEVDKWKWISLDEAESLLHEAQQKNISAIKELVNQARLR